jgi:hypothetical protein
VPSSSLTIRFLASLSNVLFSLILGAIAMFLFLFYFPDQSAWALRKASGVKEWIVGHSGSSLNETILRFVLQDGQLLLMSFVMVTRVVLGLAVLLLIGTGRWLKALVVAEP